MKKKKGSLLNGRREKDDKACQVGIKPTGSDVTEGERRKGVSRSLLQIQRKKASRRELEEG